LKRLVAILALLAVVLTACGSNTTPAATVDGRIITVGDVESFMAEDTGAADVPTFSEFLAAAIQLDILFTSAEEQYGVAPTDEEVAAEADRIYEENAVGQDRDEFLAAAGISEELLQQIARQQLVNAAIIEEMTATVEPTEEDLADARKAAEYSAAEVCASHILVATEEEATDVLARLEDGEDFADIASELSLDTTSGANGGELECAPPSTYVDEFADATMTAEIGEITEPIETQYGFHLIIVHERTDANPADIPSDAQLTEQITPVLAQEAFSAWYNDQMTAAEVVVEPEFGSWDPVTLSVVPPEGTSSTTTVPDGAGSSSTTAE
jgi:parvulin-like peptidyl-prolyl isomerase